MRLKIYLKSVFLFLGSIGFSQIPNLPTVPTPGTHTFQNHAEQSLSGSQKNTSSTVLQNYGNINNIRAERQNIKVLQRDVDRFEQDKKENEKTEFLNRVKDLEKSGYRLPSLENMACTGHYYEAFSKLSRLDLEHYSVAEAVFIVENPFYNGKMDFHEFIGEIRKTAKQVIKRMKDDRVDIGDNTMKNIALFRHFSKAYKYDFDDYFGSKDWSKMFVSKLIKTGKGQCHSMPLLYLVIAEQIGAEASLSTAPNHTYIRFLDSENQWQNIELTNGILTTNSMILQSGYIGSEAVQSGIYMNSLDKKQLMSNFYADLANGYMHKFGMDEFVGKTLDKALELHPDNMYANLLKSIYQQARFKYVTDNLGIKDPEDPQQLQDIRYFSGAVELLQQTKAQFDKIDNLGFRLMSGEAYSEWLSNMGKEESRRQSEEIAENIKRVNVEMQRKKQQEQKKNLEQGKKPKEKQNPKYIPIDPTRL